MSAQEVSALEEGEKKTKLALMLIFSTAKMIIQKKEVEDEQMKATGRAIGWIAIVTAGTQYDVFKTLNGAIAEAVEYNNSNKASTIDTSDTRSLVKAAGKHKKFGGNEEERSKKQKTGIVVVTLLGALIVIFGASQYYNVTNAQKINANVRTNAKEVINNVCTNIVPFTELPPEPPSWWEWRGWSGEYKQELASYGVRKLTAEQKAQVCENTKNNVVEQVKIADKELTTVFANIPTNINSAITVLSYVASVTGGDASLPLVTQLASALTQFTKSAMTGTLPNTQELDSFTKGIGVGFGISSSSTTTSAAAAPASATGKRGQPPAAPAAPSMAPAAAPAFTLPPTGGRRTRIKRTKKRGLKKLKKTRRGIHKPLFKY
jgi:hypothetical protein